MAVPVSLRGDFGEAWLRGLARKTKDGPQARRRLALAAIYDGATRTEAAKIGGVGVQIIRDWVLRFNARGPDGPGRQGAGPALLATFGLGAVAIWGFIEGRQELAKEAQRERPVKTPQRISIEAGEPVITLDAATQAQSGLQTAILQQTQYHEQLHAFAHCA